MKETPFFTSFAILIWGSIGWFALPGCRASDFPELYNSEPKSEESRTPPKQAARETQIDEGFRLSVFARDPDVQNPIDSAWDDRGRLWIAENYTYAERTQKFDRSLRDRVVVLEGTGGDTATKRTVFTDQVQMLTSVEVGLGGVWLMCPPQVLFIPDEDGDLVPDGPAEVVLDGFKVAEANYHNFANGLRFGPDGWLYGRCGGSCPGRVGKPGTPEEERVAVEGAIWRYNVQTEIFEVLTSGTTNPWGHDFNRLGEGFFINTVNGHFWHLIHGAHFTRPFTLDPNSDTYALIDMHADHYHFDTGSAWHQQRAGVANSFGGGHAHVGGMIYQGTAWPDSYRGDFYTLNFHGRRVNREHLHDHGSGFVAHHGEDTFITPDVWFRGMELSSGPDGNVFVLDWSDAGECHEHDGVHRTSGAIFKWSYDQSPNSADRSIVPDFRGLESGELVALNLDDDVWYRRQARLELQRRKNDQKLDQTAINLVKSHLSDRHPTWIRAQSLMTLSAIGQPIDSELLVDADAKIRKLAVRLLGQHWPIDDAMGDSWKQSFSVSIPSGVRTQILRAASVEDEPSVLLDYASMLQRLPYDFRVDLAEALVGKAIAIGDHNLPKMIWYGLIPVARNNPAALASVLRQSVIPETSRYVARAMASKTRSHPDALAACVEAMPGLTSELQHATLTGLMDAFTGWRKVDPPAEWSSVQKRLADEEQIQELSEQLSALFGDGQAIETLVAVVKDRDADPKARHQSLRTLIESRADGYLDVCRGLLKDAHINVIAAEGLATSDDPVLARELIARYRNFRAPTRPGVISILVSRTSFAIELMKAIESGKIGKDAVSAYQIRQLRNLNDSELEKLLAEVWGAVAETPQQLAAQIEELRLRLEPGTIANADLSVGRKLFSQACATCHKLYGEGQNIGPDLTGANRTNLSYLLENIVSPSSVVDASYRMTQVLTVDGQLVGGLKIRETEEVIEIRTAEKTITLPTDEVEVIRLTDQSPMPTGLLDPMTSDQVRDLIGYLMHSTQVALP